MEKRKTIYLKNIAICSEFIFFLLSLLIMTLYIDRREYKNFLNKVEKNTFLADAHLISMLNLKAPAKILQRYLKGKGDLHDLIVFTNNITLNNPSSTYYIKINGQSSGERPPAFINKNSFKIGRKYQLFNYKNDIILSNRLTTSNSELFTLYNINQDILFKSKLLNSDIQGYSIENNGKSIRWLTSKTSIQKNYNIVNLKDYKMHSYGQLIKVPNSNGYPGISYIMSDNEFIRNKTKSIHFFYLIAVILFSIALKLTDLFSKILESLIQDMKELSVKGEVNKGTGKYSRFKEYHNIIRLFNSIIKLRLDTEKKLFLSYREMEYQVEKRTSALKSAMERAEFASKEKMNFLAQVSHEIRTPMNCIIGFCEISLSSRHKKDADYYTNKIILESETLLRLVNDILDDSEIENGKMKLEKNTIHLKDFINRICDLGTPFTTNKDLILNYNIDGTVPECITIDELRLYQIISNIYFNALKYTSKGTIEIKVSSSSNKIMVIKISDTGIGIPDNKVDFIFKDYERIRGNLNRGIKGTGLGLTLTKKIVNLMGGSIEVQSKEGKGSTFTLKIPYLEAENKETENIIKIEKNSPKFISKDILLVEDYPTNRMIARNHLESIGLNVFEAVDGNEAIKICKKKKFDLILMDIQMPGLNGFESTEQIREQSCINKSTPIYAITANGQKSVETKSKEVGMDGIIHKPIRKKEFLETISNLLNNEVTIK